MDMEAVLDDLAKAIVDGRKETAALKVREALAAGKTVDDVLVNGIAKGMEIVRERLRNQEYFLIELFLSNEAMRTAREVLGPYLETEGVDLPRVVIGTVHHDHVHNINKDVIAINLEGAGFNVFDLGNDVSPGKFVKTVKEVNAKVLAISCEMISTRRYIKETIEALKEANIRNKVNVLALGIAVTKDFADEIGADAYARDFTEAVLKARKLVQK